MRRSNERVRRRHIRRLAGLALVLVGLTLVLFPFVSVWRASGQVLDLLPEIAAAEVTDERHRITGLFDRDFVLARRTYIGAEIDVIEHALRTSGYDDNTRSSRWGDRIFSRECCGAYDAAWVHLDDRDPDAVIARLTMGDSDIQASWPVFAVPGVVLTIVGLALASFPSRPRPEQESRPAQ